MMTISDIITLVSLVLAIVAILNEKNRQHLLLKFHKGDYIFFVIAFIFINYFVFYDSFFSKGFFLKQLYFSNYGLKNPKNSAYPIAILSLGWFAYKVWDSFYPRDRIDKVIKFYQKQIENNEIHFLLDLIERYHKNDIIKGINQSEDYFPKPFSWRREPREVSLKDKFKRKLNEFVRSLDKFIQVVFPRSWQNKRDYASSVLYNILNEPTLISLAANQRPYLFADIIGHFKERKRYSFPDDLANSFLSEMLTSKNFWLKKELKLSKNFDFGQPAIFFEDNRILGSLLNDLSVADVNEVWRPFGEIACNEIEEERENGYSSKLLQEYGSEQLLWEYRTMFSIQFFKIIIIESLNKKYDTKNDFWLYYYSIITDAILKTLEKFPSDNIENTKTNLHALVEIMIDNLFLWLDISNEKEDLGLYKSITDCLGSSINSICKNSHYGESRKIEILDRLLYFYCRLKTNSQSDNIRMYLEMILSKSDLLGYLQIAWNDFDKVPHLNNSDYFTRLNDKVITPCGLI